MSHDFSLLAPLFLQGGSQPSVWVQFAPLIIMFGIFYLIWWLPMRRRQKAHDQMLRELKKGDKVVTSGGLHGEIAAVRDDDVLQVKLADNLKVRVSRSAISGLQGETEPGGDR